MVVTRIDKVDQILPAHIELEIGADGDAQGIHLHPVFHHVGDIAAVLAAANRHNAIEAALGTVFVAELLEELPATVPVQGFLPPIGRHCTNRAHQK